ncbi:class I SAM-dependent methyltransferase [Chloroflexota bacterium]
MRYISHKYFIAPPLVDFKEEDQPYAQNYSSYNYLRSGIASFMRRRHFEYALRLTKNYFHRCNVIDFGCNDGPLIPSLAQYFNYVVGIDKSSRWIMRASEVIRSKGLKNVKLICNHDLTLDSLKEAIGPKKFHILYLLETIEHVGDKSNPLESKVDFIRSLFELLDDNGIIVMSVPVMIGIPFLLQRIAFRLLGSNREPISLINLIKASILNDSSNLEKQWDGGHLGFNHRKLENYLKKEFYIPKVIDLFFQCIYVCQK